MSNLNAWNTVKRGDVVTICPALSQHRSAYKALYLDGSTAIVEGLRGNGRGLSAKVTIRSGPHNGAEDTVPFDSLRLA